MDQVGWGRVDLATLKQLIDLHTAASDFTRRTPYLATIQSSNALDAYPRNLAAGGDRQTGARRAGQARR